MATPLAQQPANNLNHRCLTASDAAPQYERRSTTASEIQAHYARRQFQIGIPLGIISFLAALFSGFAAWQAGRAATAASKSNEIARETAAKELRAYVHVDGADKEGNIIKIKIRNFGQTPAYRVKSNHRVVISFAGTPSFEISDREGEIELGPSQSYDVSASADLGVKFFGKGSVTDTAGVIYYGKIVYFDAFSKEERVTEYRLKLISMDDGPLIFCTDGNRAT